MGGAGPGFHSEALLLLRGGVYFLSAQPGTHGAGT